MSRKFSNLDTVEKKDIENQLESLSSAMGMDAWEVYVSREGSLLQDQIGICYNCKNLNYCRTEFGTVFAKCSEFEFRMNGQNRIEECNLHSPKNALSLNEMYAMAYLIDPSEEKVEGFISTNKRYMKTKLKPTPADIKWERKKGLPVSRPLKF